MLAYLLQMADYIRNERNVLDRLHHPGIAQLQFTFQVGAGFSSLSTIAAACLAAAEEQHNHAVAAALAASS
jgi:hypothetical protein